MATDRLKLYNGALLICKARQIASLSVNEEPRYLLDNVWNDGAIRFCLEQAQWKFAMCAAERTYDSAVEPAFGYNRAFAKPSDWVLTSAVCQDERFQTPLLQYADEIGYWFADNDTIYTKHVSDDAAYGMNLSNWPYSFTEYVKHFLAGKIVGKMSQDQALTDRLLGPPGRPEHGMVHAALVTAMNKDAMAGPTKRPAPGTWIRSRFGSGQLKDGGNPGQLIG